MGKLYQRGEIWYIDYRVDGKRIRKAAGNDRAMAEIVLKDTEVKIAKGTYLGVQDKKQIRFNALVKRVLAWAEVNNSQSTNRHLRHTIRRDFIPHFRNRYISEITREHVDAYIIKRNLAIKNHSINTELVMLRTIFRLAEQWGYTTQLPMQQIKMLKFQDPEFSILKKEDIPSLLAACSPTFFPIVATALNTGMRKGEILPLKWRDVDLVSRQITVKGEAHTKSYRVRHVPISAFLLDVLQNLPRIPGVPFVFLNTRGKPYKVTCRAFQSALRKAKIPHIRFHDLRHTFASHLVMAGVDIRTVQQLLGHRDITTTMRYAHLAHAHLNAAVEKIEMGTIWSQAPNSTPKPAT